MQLPPLSTGQSKRPLGVKEFHLPVLSLGKEGGRGQNTQLSSTDVQPLTAAGRHNGGCVSCRVTAHQPFPGLHCKEFAPCSQSSRCAEFIKIKLNKVDFYDRLSKVFVVAVNSNISNIKGKELQATSLLQLVKGTIWSSRIMQPVALKEPPKKTFSFTVTAD